MKATSEKMIGVFAKRSNSTIMLITLFFAMVGALLAIFTEGKGIWGVWIPFCFITIPPIHYLCRKVKELSCRLDEMEKTISHNKSMETDG